MDGKNERIARATVAARAGWGAFLLGAPDVVLAGFGLRDHRPAAIVLRVLGGRHLAQAALTAAMPRPVVVRLGAAADALHAATMAGVVMAATAWRRAAAADTVAALAFSAAGWATLRCGRHAASARGKVPHPQPFAAS